VLVIALVAASCGDQGGTAESDDGRLSSGEVDSLPLVSQSSSDTDPSERNASTSTVQVEESTTTSVQPPETGPAETIPAGLLDQELAILGSDRGAVELAIADLGGVITVEVPETSTYQVSFPVDSFEELLAIRKQLEAAGLDVVLVPTVESP
jgi:hypothetical protein